MSLGKRIKEQRKLLGINQQELADKIDMSLNSIKRLETDRMIPSLETFQKLCDIFGCTADYLLGRELSPANLESRKTKLLRIQASIFALKTYTDRNPPFRILNEYSDAISDYGITFKSLEFIKDPNKHMDNMLQFVEEELKKLEK